MTGGPAAVRSPASGGEDPEVDGGLELAAERGPDVGGGRATGSGARRFQLDGQAEFGEAAGVQRAGSVSVRTRVRNTSGEQPVFVCGRLVQAVTR